MTKWRCADLAIQAVVQGRLLYNTRDKNMTSNVASKNWDDLSIAAMARLRFAVRRSDTERPAAHDLTLGSQDKNYEKNNDEQESAATYIPIANQNAATRLDFDSRLL
jgi:hypothetical protein